MHIRKPTPMWEEVPLAGPVSVAIREFSVAAFTRPWHRHREAELTWIIEGEGLRYVGDSVEPFRAGDCCLLAPYLPHAWLSAKREEGPWSGQRQRRGVRAARARSLVVQFDLARLGETFWHLPELARVARLLDAAKRGLWFEETLGAALREKLLRATTPLSRLTALLTVLEELAAAPARPLSLIPWMELEPEINAAADARLRRVLAYLGAHATEPLSQAQIARQAGQSPPAFSRFFRRAMGKTYQTYVTDLRLSLACRQLVETNRTVSEIAYAVGFGNLSNFNRSFRLKRGMAPREFRRQALREQPTP